MAMIHAMIRTAQIYAEAHEFYYASCELNRALALARSMRQTRRVRIVRAHIVQCIIRLREAGRV